MTCPNCGTDADRHLVPVWEDPEDPEAGRHPDYVGCTNCHRMHRPDLIPDEDEEVPPQAPLTDHERSRLAAKNAVGNQNNSKLTIIEWRCVKGAAAYYGVSDWTSKADPTLTKDENVGLMKRYATKNSETTLRDRRTPHKHGQSISD